MKKRVACWVKYHFQSFLRIWQTGQGTRVKFSWISYQTLKVLAFDPWKVPPEMSTKCVHFMSCPAAPKQVSFPFVFSASNIYYSWLQLPRTERGYYQTKSSNIGISRPLWNYWRWWCKISVTFPMLKGPSSCEAESIWRNSLSHITWPLARFG